ncbi:fasciclin domain-containing protein [Zobellia uliginosa]|uniref:fasciclin domain-containing protein n=1 Tax=Zobellia uliginosa TaxID=143224 RepID=UPI0026E3D9D7|nr:fasciclin domain-containing protein [Zobellia uliginosa]MDO6516947.1 fasciclin domain-containing protein [Zobellia uliginosa]
MMITRGFLKNLAMLLMGISMAIGCSKGNDVVEDVEKEISKEEGQTDEAEGETPREEEADDETLVNAAEFIQSEDSLTIAAEALKTIDDALVEKLSDENGKLTFFVPSNKAFTEFLASLKEYADVLDFDEDLEKEILAQVLKYHAVVDGANFSTELSNGSILQTLQSEEIKITVDGDVYIIDTTEIHAQITTADIEVANGVLHIIDKVLIPEAVLEALFPKSSLIDLVNESDDLSMFADAIAEAGLETRFNDGDYTVFAPTNTAIETLFQTLGDDYNSFQDFSSILEKQALKEIILGHAVEQVIARNDLKVGELPTLISGDSIEVVEGAGGMALQDASDDQANFVEFDIEASNGVIHTIDKILIPQKALLLLN